MEENTMTLANPLFCIGLVMGTAVIASLVFLLFRKKKEADFNIHPHFSTVDETVDEYTFPEIIKYFRDPERLQLLRNNTNYAAAAVKKAEADAIKISLCVFDTKTSQIVTPHVRTIAAKRLHEDVVKHFGNKDMIILQ